MKYWSEFIRLFGHVSELLHGLATGLVDAVSNPYSLAALILLLLFAVATGAKALRSEWRYRTLFLVPAAIVLVVALYAIIQNAQSPARVETKPTTRTLQSAAQSAPGPIAQTTTSITATGSHSTVINNVVGNVTVNSLADKQDEAHPLKITYYRLKGFGINLLINGRIAPQWRQIFGDDAAVIENPVYSETKHFMDMFAEPVLGDVISFNFGHGDDYDQREVTQWDLGAKGTTSPRLLRAYLGGMGR